MHHYRMSKLKINMKYQIVVIAMFMSLVACNYNKDFKSRQADLVSLTEDTFENLVKPNDNKLVFNDSLTYTTIKFYKETKRNKNTADSSKYAYMRATYPKFDATHHFLNNKISNIVAAEDWTENKTYNIDETAKSFFKEYAEFAKEIADSQAGYSSDTDITVALQDTNLVVLKSECYVYTGGAHGLESVVYLNLDLKDNKALVLKDLLIDNYSNRLTNIAEEIFRKNEGLTASESLDGYFFENQLFAINENFAIKPNGLMFTYNPYEIKSYAEGTTDLLIPYAKIKELIKPNSFISKYVIK